MEALKLVSRAGVPFLVGGAYAFERFTGIPRHSRDLDLFVREADARRVMDLFAAPPYRTDVPFPHWLGKIYKGRTTVDVIWSSGNGIARVDDPWFERAIPAEVLGVPVKLVPVEEMIWSKAFIMERERFDGADVLHVLLAHATTLDWDHLLRRFEPYPLILLTHLVLFLFVYPSEAERIPRAVWDRLLGDLEQRRGQAPSGVPICRGTLLSRSQYLVDAMRGYQDARLPPEGGMNHRDLAAWTEAAKTEDRSGVPERLVVDHAQTLRDQSEAAPPPAPEPDPE